MTAFARGLELLDDGFKKGVDGAGVGPITEREGVAGAKGGEEAEGGEGRRGRTEEGAGGHCSNGHNEK